MFVLTFKTDNEAFTDRETEVPRILRAIALRVEEGVEEGPVMDVNGNKVGSWSF